MIRFEIIQNSMSLLPTAALKRRTNVPSASRKSAIAIATARLPGHLQGRDRDDHGDQKHKESHDRGELDLKTDAHQRVGRKRADDEREHRARERHYDRVEIGAERVVLQQHEVPRVERRLEIDERNVERPAVDLDLDLERGHEHPVEGKEDDERPQAEDRRKRRPSSALTSPRGSSASNRRRMRPRDSTRAAH